MYKVNYNKKISPDAYEMEIVSPLAVKNALPGQFVIVMAKESTPRSQRRRGSRGQRRPWAGARVCGDEAN